MTYSSVLPLLMKRWKQMSAVRCIFSSSVDWFSLPAVYIQLMMVYSGMKVLTGRSSILKKYTSPFSELSPVGLTSDLVDWPLSFSAMTWWVRSCGPYNRLRNDL